VDDTRAFVDAGVFAIILEYVPFEITQYLAKTLPVPIISVSSGPSPDGIYIGTGDAVGYSAFPRPRQAKAFVDASALIAQGLRTYKEHVLSGRYPLDEHTQHMNPDEHRRFLALCEGSATAAGNLNR
jgi:3-methyl-2-oxobutanoate hydroxymethyltransferase